MSLICVKDKRKLESSLEDTSITVITETTDPKVKIDGNEVIISITLQATNNGCMGIATIQGTTQKVKGNNQSYCQEGDSTGEFTLTHPTTGATLTENIKISKAGQSKVQAS